MAAVATIKSKPTAKEITHKTDEAGTHYDGFIYEGATLQEKNALGALYVVGQVKYGDEDLAYLVNLISSLAKREYYSDSASQSITAKTAFESTLKKLNEVLEDFFKNKEFKLTVGLAAIAGDNIYISRLGNVRFGLVREDNYIDVINNIGLFNREHVEEKEFSNVISGKLLPQDKLFMYLPLRPVVSREKSLRELLKKEPQEVFADKISNLAKTAANFACCGIHVEMNSIKEIPVEARPSYYTTMAVKTEEPEKPEPKSHHKVSPPAAVEPTATLASIEDDEVSDVTEKISPPAQQPRIISADVSLVRRKSFVTKLAGFWSGSRSVLPSAKRPKNMKLWLGGGVVLVVVIVAAYLIFAGGNSPDKALLKQAKTDLKLVQDDIAKGDYRAARSLGYTSITNLAASTTKQAQTLRDQLTAALKNIDKTSDTTPRLFSGETAGNGLIKLASDTDKVYALSGSGEAFVVSDQGFKSIGTANATNSQFFFNTDKLVAIADGKLNILNKTNGKTDGYALTGFEGTKDATLYEGNIYALGGDSISKYLDVVTTEAKPANWAKDIPASGQSITVDGNLYLLNSDGKVGVYFKGTKQSEYDLALTPSPATRIFTAKDVPFLYYTDPTARKVMVFDKTNGELKTSYDLSSAGTITDITVAKDQSIYLLSADNKVWLIK